MDDSNKAPEWLQQKPQPFISNWVLGTGIGVVVAGVCAGVYCLFAAENAAEGQNTTIPKPSHNIIERPKNR